MGTCILGVFCLIKIKCVRVRVCVWDHSWAGGTGLVERAVVNTASMLAGLWTVDLSASLWGILALGPQAQSLAPMGHNYPVPCVCVCEDVSREYFGVTVSWMLCVLYACAHVLYCCIHQCNYSVPGSSSSSLSYAHIPASDTNCRERYMGGGIDGIHLFDSFLPLQWFIKAFILLMGLLSFFIVSSLSASPSSIFLSHTFTFT